MSHLKTFLKNKDHIGVQFIKYAFCGGVAVFADIVAFFLLAWLVFPALTSDETIVKLFHLDIVEVPDSEFFRILNLCIGKTLAFFISNTVAYLLNILFVFRSGKHSRLKEMGLFYLVSGISVGIGIALGALITFFFHSDGIVFYLTTAISTMLINFVARKFIIFKH